MRDFFPTAAAILVAASSTLVIVLGLMHLRYTFFTTKLTPRDSMLRTSMSSVSPVLTRQTTMWKAWVGFNVSHSVGIIVFGLLYAYLALAERVLFFRSIFLIVLGFAMLATYVVLATVYWFSGVRRLVMLALLIYAAGVIAAVAARF